MITGFNTDVKYGDRVYHVQTEDKGVENPIIESLIYIKGAILDSHRTRYLHFLASGSFSESILQRILEFQHKQIVSLIKKGQFKKGMPLQAFVDGSFIFELKDRATEKARPEEASEPGHTQVLKSSGEQVLHHPLKVPKKEELPPPQSLNSQSQEQRQNSSRPEPRPLQIPGTGSDTRGRAEAPANRIEFAIEVGEAAELEGEQGIEICVVSSKDFVGGSHVDLELYVQSRQSRFRLENVQVMIKVIGTTFGPRLYAGKTDRNGNLRMNFNLPTYSVGSAALIIQASTAVGSDEIKYLIKRK